MILYPPSARIYAGGFMAFLFLVTSFSPKIALENCNFAGTIEDVRLVYIHI